MADETPFVDHEGLDEAEAQVLEVLANLDREYRQEAEPWVKRLQQIRAFRKPKMTWYDDPMADPFEDAQLNAIADERAEGPFVRVTLGDLQPTREER
jgi:hypothetical protein